MSKPGKSPEYEVLGRLLTAYRLEAQLTQVALASRLGRPQSAIAEIEAGRRRIQVIELMDYSRAIGFDPCDLIQRLRSQLEPQPS